MPNIEIEKNKNTIKLTITVSTDEARPFLEEAAQAISIETKIDGFRPGKAGYDVVKNRVGEMKIYEASLEHLVRKTYTEALLNNNLEVIGSPTVDIKKLVPNNDIVYTAEVSLMPKIIQLADLSKLSPVEHKVKVTDKDIDRTLNNLRRMQTKEARASAEELVNENDKVIIAVDMKKDGVSVEGGQSPNHAVFLSEEYYIPGFKEELIGMKEGEKKSFTLPFPKEHNNKMLSGQEILFEVNLKELFHLEEPEYNDAFATGLGQKTMTELRDVLRKNIESEKQQEAKALEERDLLEELAKNSRFEDFPDLLINQEIDKMLNELKHGVEEQGLNFETYLSNMNKTLPQIKIDFTPQAIMRIKVALLLTEIAKQEKIEPDSTEVDKDIDQVAAKYPDNKEAKDHFYSPGYREYIETVKRNRMVIDYILKISKK